MDETDDAKEEEKIVQPQVHNGKKKSVKSDLTITRLSNKVVEKFLTASYKLHTEAQMEISRKKRTPWVYGVPFGSLQVADVRSMIQKLFYDSEFQSNMVSKFIEVLKLEDEAKFWACFLKHLREGWTKRHEICFKNQKTVDLKFDGSHKGKHPIDYFVTELTSNDSQNKSMKKRFNILTQIHCKTQGQ